ncbi:MAG: zinc ribbon domain-containing protein [Candidatus Methanoperedens sp.]|nr:zinc ribbon domain-containing protein [Candidatus Methanoperedens sp.]
MNCSGCGAAVRESDKFCSRCGAPVVISSQFCPECGKPVAKSANFCTNCGYSFGKPASAPQPREQPSTIAAPPSQTQGMVQDYSGEVALKDTGFFPISYIKSMMSSTNGKLTLTNMRLIFKASALQGVGGTALPGGIFIPNPKDAEKSKEYFAIPLAEITNVESGWASLTVHAGGQKYKFGGMRDTKKWAETVNSAIGSLRK